MRSTRLFPSDKRCLSSRPSVSVPDYAGHGLGEVNNVAVNWISVVELDVGCLVLRAPEHTRNGSCVFERVLDGGTVGIRGSAATCRNFVSTRPSGCGCADWAASSEGLIAPKDNPARAVAENCMASRRDIFIGHLQ